LRRWIGRKRDYPGLPLRQNAAAGSWHGG